MPGLLDLPAELIERIYHHYDDLLPGDRRQASGGGNFLKIEAGPQLRLTCRYIERATRRLFLKTHFGSWRIETSSDTSFENFYAMAKTSDLAECLRSLTFDVEDDYSIRVQKAEAGAHQINKPCSLKVADTTHPFDGIPGALVLPALLRHNTRMVVALQACQKLDEIRFYNRQHEDSDFYQEPDQTRVNDRLVCDFTASIGHLVCLLESANRFPTALVAWAMPRTSLIPRIGLTDCANLAERKHALSKLTKLALTLFWDCRDHRESPAESGRRLAHQLGGAFQNLTMLKSLRIDVANAEASDHFWSVFAKLPPFCKLDQLELGDCTIQLDDLVAVVSKYYDSLRVLELQTLYLSAGAVYILGNFYADMRHQARIQRFEQWEVYLEDEAIEFPMRLRDDIDDVDGWDEEDYVSLIPCPIQREGADEVQELLRELSEHCQSA